MGEFFTGQICAFGFNFAPQNWVKCEGQLLEISQYQVLYSLLGDTYGGDGRTTFGLPDLRGATIVSASTTIPMGKIGMVSLGEKPDNSIAFQALNNCICVNGIYPTRN